MNLKDPETLLETAVWLIGWALVLCFGWIMFCFLLAGFVEVVKAVL